MNRSVIVLASAGCLVPALMVAASAQPPEQPASPPPAPPPPTQPGAKPAETTTSPDKLPNNTNADGSLKVVVHTDRTPESTTDRRSDMGSVHVSFPPTEAGSRAQAEMVAAAEHRSSGTIDVPANTLGPGTPMWLVRDRENADRRIAEAQADVAKAIAERTDAASAYYEGYALSWPLIGRSGYWSHGPWAGGLRGPVTTTTTYSDQLGSTAQRAWSEAAYPRNSANADAHDRAVRQFGRDATPPVNRIQNDVDQAHRRANTEHPR